MDEHKKATCLPPVGIPGEDLPSWICWNLWKTRNKLIFNDKSFSYTETILKAITDCKEWREAQPGKSLKIQSPPTPMARLKEGTIICRSDAAWKENSKSARLGWIFLRNRTEVITNHISASPFVNSPLVVEVMAMRAAIAEAWNAGFKDLLVESDSKTLIRAIKEKIWIPEIYGILVDITLIAYRFDSIAFNFISRDFNGPTDLLAKKTLMSFVNLY